MEGRAGGQAVAQAAAGQAAGQAAGRAAGLFHLGAVGRAVDSKIPRSAWRTPEPSATIALDTCFLDSPDPRPDRIKPKSSHG